MYMYLYNYEKTKSVAFLKFFAIFFAGGEKEMVNSSKYNIGLFVCLFTNIYIFIFFKYRVYITQLNHTDENVLSINI